MFDRLFIDQFISRILYIINTIDSYFLIAGILSLVIFFIIYKKHRKNFWKNKIVDSIYIIFYLFFMIVCFKLADFYPYFLLFGPFLLFFLFKTKNFSLNSFFKLFLINIIVFFAIQISVIGGAQVVILKDVTIPLRVAVNSIFTIAPTNLSALISIYFATLFSVILYFKPRFDKDKNAMLFVFVMLFSAILTFLLLPTTPESEVYHPEIIGEISDRVILLTVDGWRFDRFSEALEGGELPFLKELIDKGVFFEKGATGIYRALTEPGLVSFLTGLPPEKHKVKSNSDFGSLNIETIPDKVKTKLYGNVHMAKVGKEWDNSVVSLSKYGWKTDDVVFERLKKDVLEDVARFYFADLSDVDLVGHAYGSFTRHYVEANKRLDLRLKDLVSFLEKNDLLDSTTLIISSEHGHAGIDHGYFHVDAERYVPMIFFGNGIKKGVNFDFRPSIIDINPTVIYLLGVDYPAESRGRVLTEVIDYESLGND